MYRRDYLYVRKSVVDPGRKLMVMVSRATNHPQKPESDQYVRVSTYRSQMCIKPHNTFDDVSYLLYLFIKKQEKSRNVLFFFQNGFDYILTYYDDPKGNFPTAAYKWMASKGKFQFHYFKLVYQENCLNAKYHIY